MEKRSRKSPPFEINGEYISPGTRQLVSIQAGTTMSNHPLSVTADIFHGKKPGPCLLITACVHGDEINGTEIIRRLLTSPVLKRLSGTLLTIPIVNFPAFTSRTRYLPDRRDLNRIFPGSEKGSQGARLAYTITKKFLPLCDAVIDLHTGAINRPNLPQLRIAAGDASSLELGRAFAAPVTMLSPLRDGTFRESAFKLEKPFVLYEAGEASRLDAASIRFGVQGIIAAMRHMGMLPPSKAAHPSGKGIISKSSRWERAPSGGLFVPHVALGKAVATGDILGIIAPPVGGGDGTPIISTTDGIVIGRNNEGLADEGDALFHVASIRDAGSAETQIQESNDRLPELHAEEEEHPMRYHAFPD
ncbi:succinylglutamate desuccinylase/aspartoacylase family protein [Luteolibacter sp. AS25]|uniref:succinylglutamate desuccinylase/aspartoacylase family protein n=1 Tax=Luteolibacter sp. AS25 TaxID=3135776 RepID=UPI00398BA89F